MTRHNDSVTATEDPTAWLRAQLDDDEREWAAIARGPRKNGKTFAFRMLREVEAKRRRLARHQPMGNGCCDYCHEWGGELVAWPCVEIRDDASVYADRPGYREEWRP